MIITTHSINTSKTSYYAAQPVTAPTENLIALLSDWVIAISA
jgi:hypothetical protein